MNSNPLAYRRPAADRLYNTYFTYICVYVECSATESATPAIVCYNYDDYYRSGVIIIAKEK